MADLNNSALTSTLAAQRKNPIAESANITGQAWHSLGDWWANQKYAQNLPEAPRIPAMNVNPQALLAATYGLPGAALPLTPGENTVKTDVLHNIATVLPGYALATDKAERVPLNLGLELGGGVGDAAALGTKFLASNPQLLAALAASMQLKKPALGDFPTTTAGRIRNQTEKEGGITVSMKTGEEPQEGLMVGKYANTDPRNMVLTGKIKNSNLEDFVQTNRKSLDSIGNYLGTWKEEATGKIYLDVSQRFEPDEIRKATKFGERTGQIAGFNRGKFEEFQIGNWSDFIRTDDFANRMKEMSVVGRDYLNKHSNKEWWDMYGTVFEDVYGTEHMEALAGYIASTAPNTNPTQNIRMASEYMRRHLLGEEIIQPQWRVPGGTQSRTEGVQIGMEAGRVKNLTASQEGRIQDLSAEKVRNEALALLGDPDAAVFDRWWARLAEDAEKGVYTAAKDGTFESAKKTYNQYNDLLEVVRGAAKQEGRSARNYSADVWTGVRETVKETDALFGAKFQGSALTGESKGYADLFSDLIKSKADFLGISVGKFKSRLAKGDAELLTLLLGAPLGAHAFSQLESVGSDISPTPGSQQLAEFL